MDIVKSPSDTTLYAPTLAKIIGTDNKETNLCLVMLTYLNLLHKSRLTSQLVKGRNKKSKLEFLPPKKDPILQDKIRKKCCTKKQEKKQKR